jgi:hypothetical protein
MTPVRSTSGAPTRRRPADGRRLRAVVLGAAAAVLGAGVLLAGCGGGDDSLTAEEWANQFCTVTNTWTDSVREATDDVRDATVSVDGLRAAATETREATDAYVVELRDLGAPDTSTGDSIETAVEELADEVDREAAEIEDAVEDVSGVAGVASAARDVGASVGAMFVSFSRLSEVLEESDPEGELEQAFESSDACGDLG